MKVQDLFEALSYDEKRKTPVGDVKEWMAAIGASKEDIAAGREAAVKSSQYEELIAAGFEDTSGAQQKKNGSVQFTVTYFEPRRQYGWIDKKTGKEIAPKDLSLWGNWEKYKTAVVAMDPHNLAEVRLRYTVLANGKVDFTAPNDYHRWPAPSGKTRVVAGKPAASVESSLKMGMDSILRLYGKRMKELNNLKKKFKLD